MFHKREKRYVDKRNLIPSFDARTLEIYLGKMAQDGLRFTGFGKKGILHFERAVKQTVNYKVVFISEIREKSTGEFLSLCETNGLVFIDRLDAKDIFVFDATNAEPFAEADTRGKIRDVKSMLIYSAIFLVSLLLTVLCGWFLLIKNAFGSYFHDALRYYISDFRILGVKLLTAGMLCLLVAAGILWIRYLNRNRIQKLPAKRDGITAWKRMYTLAGISAILIVFSILTAIIGGVRHARAIYTYDYIPSVAETIDFSVEGDSTTSLVFTGEAPSLLLPDHYLLTWNGTEYTKDQKIVDKRFAVETLECLTEGTAKKLYKHYALKDDVGEWKALSDSQCNHMAVDAGKYAKDGQRWYLLLRSGNIVYEVQTYNLYCDESIDGSITEAVMYRATAGASRTNE